MFYNPYRPVFLEELIVFPASVGIDKLKVVRDEQVGSRAKLVALGKFLDERYQSQSKVIQMTLFSTILKMNYVSLHTQQRKSRNREQALLNLIWRSLAYTSTMPCNFVL